MNTNTNTISITTRAAAFHETLSGIIRPKDCSDRTAFRRVVKWLTDECNEGRFDADIFPVVLDLAREAAGPQCRKPAAVFMSLIKKELGYSPKSDARGGK
jgi:hypothetical protein